MIDNTSAENTRKELDGVDKQIEDLKIRRKQILSKLQFTCQHPLVTETPLYKFGYFSESCPPARICETCGKEEETFGIFKILTAERVRIVNRDNYYKYRL